MHSLLTLCKCTLMAEAEHPFWLQPVQCLKAVLTCVQPLQR